MTYGGGDYRYLVDGSNSTTGRPPQFGNQRAFDAYVADECGDTLFLFLMRELSDANVGPGYESEAPRLVQCAINELLAILPAVSLC